MEILLIWHFFFTVLDPILSGARRVGCRGSPADDAEQLKGTVNLSRPLANWWDDHELAELPGIPLSSRDHQTCRLALLPIFACYRDVEDILAQRGVTLSHETIRQWCRKFGPQYARALIRRRGRLGDTWHLDELSVTIRGQRHYLWRAVDEDGDVIDILVQSRRDRRAAKRFFRKLLKGQGSEPRRLVTDRLRSYGAAHRAVMPSVIHDTARYANNRAEVSHQPTRNGSGR